MTRPRALVLTLLLAGPLAAQGDPRPPRPERPPRPARPERPSRESKPSDPYREPEPLKPPAEHPGAVPPKAQPERRESGGWGPPPLAPQAPLRRAPRPGYAPPGGSDTSTTLHPGQGSLYPTDRRSREQARTWERSGAWRANGAWGQARTWHDHRARHWEREHRTWHERGGYGGYLIPERDFRLHFGPQRWFRLHARPVIRNGYPYFTWGGYGWLILDPWPEFWVETWYADDDLYIDYDGGYYLYSRRDPGFGLAITVTF